MDRLFDLDRARELMEKRDIEVLVAVSKDNFGYLTGYFSHLGKYYDIKWMGDPCFSMVAIPLEKDVEPFFLTVGSIEDVDYIDPWIKDRRYYKPAEYGVEYARDFRTQDGRDFFEVFSEIIKEKGLEKSNIGLELGYDSYTMEIASWLMVRRLRKLLPDAKLKDASPLLREMRLIKTDEEMNRIIKSSGIVERAIKASLEEITAGMTKIDLEWIIRRNLMKDKVDGALMNIDHGYDDIHRPTNRKLEKNGDFVTIDLFSKHEQYYGDVARSVAFGEPSAKLQKVYDAIQEAHGATIDMIQFGVRCSEVFNTAAKSMKESGFAYKSPLVGHGTGICIHEQPYLGDNDMVIQPGMAFTVEIEWCCRGKGYGSCMRMEDMVICNKRGCRDITTLTKDFVRI